MRLVNRTLARFKRLKKTDYIGLLLLCLLAMIGGSACVVLDIGITNLFLKNQGLLSIGFDYLWVGIGLMGMAHYVLLLDRRKGYGATLYMLITTIFLWLLLFCVKTEYQEIVANLLFIYKYVILFLIGCALWSLSARLIKQDISSLRFVGVFISELIGYGLGGSVAIYFNHNPFVLLWSGFLITVVFIAVLKLFSDVFSIPKEMFISQMGGVQDPDSKELANAVLGIAFWTVVVRFFADYFYYSVLMEQPTQLIHTMGVVWVIIALCGAGIVGLLWTLGVWLSYMIYMGAVLVCLTVLSIVYGALCAETISVIIGIIGLTLSMRLYIHPYVKILPRILKQAKGMRLKKVSFLLLEPAAVILVGAILITQKTIILPWIFMGAGIILFFLLGLSKHIYGRLLIQGCYLKRCYKNRVVLAYFPLKQMIKQGLSGGDVSTVIYFLNLLSHGSERGYKQYLLWALKHPIPEVRKYALEQLYDITLTSKELDEVRAVFQTDVEIDVQNEALAVLIVKNAEEHDKKVSETYKPYLKNKELCFGACKGLLLTRNGRNDAVKAVTEWFNSSQTEIQRKVLELMAQRPCSEWEPWLYEILFKPSDNRTALALRAAGELKHPKLLPGILNALDDEALREEGLLALSSYGSRMLPSIEKMILNSQCPFERRKVLICFLGQLSSSAAKQVLLRALFVDSTKLRLVVVQALMGSHMIWVHQSRRQILTKSIKSDLERWLEISAEICQLRSQSYPKNIADLVARLETALLDEMDSIRRLIIYQLILLNPHTLVEESCLLLLNSDCSNYAGAASCLQDLLPKTLYQMIKDVLLNQKELNAVVSGQDLDVYFKHFILNGPKWVNEWMQVLALQCACILKTRGAMPMVECALHSADWLVLDTALWGIGRLISDKKTAQELVLTVPTRYLVQHEFQKLLEGKYGDYNG